MAKPLPEPTESPADGRSARATGRTKALATRITEELYRDLKVYAAEHGLKLVEVLELGHEALKRQQEK